MPDGKLAVIGKLGTSLAAHVGESHTVGLASMEEKMLNREESLFQLPSCSTQGVICFQEETHSVVYCAAPGLQFKSICRG